MLYHIYGLAYIITMNIEATEVFKQMSDMTRLRCLLLLQAEGELSVCELIYAIDESQPKISRHLAHLRKSGLVLDRKEGLWVFYRLNPELPEWVQAVLKNTEEGTAVQQLFIFDRLSLSSMPNRPVKKQRLAD